MSQLPFADHTGLVTSTEERLQRPVEKIGVMCESRKLRVNMGKSKVLVCSREGGQAELRVRLNGELLGEVESFKYQGSIISKDAGVSMDVRQRERGSGGLWGDEEYLESKGGWNEGKERIV